MLACGYKGRLYPVNPNRSEVQGLKSYPDVLSVGGCDVAIIAVPAPHAPMAIEQCGLAKIPFAVVLTAGFSETGPKGEEMQRQLDAAIAKSGVRVVGPNCVGVMNVITRAYMAFGGALTDKTLRPGPLAIVSQSGGFGQSMMTFANASGVGSNYVISCGNEADLTFFDFAHYLLDQDEVEMIACYMEASTDGHQLRDLGQHALKTGKPILMLKVGNSDVGRRAASSHTGKMTADYTLFRTVFREGGYIEISDLDELADVARLVMGRKYPKGKKVGVLTGSGGWGVIMAEHCEKNGLELPPPVEKTQEKLRALNSTFSSMTNPVDMMANYGDQYKALECLLDDPTFDQFLIRSAAGPDVGMWATRFIETASKTDKPIVVNWASIPSRDPDVRERIEQAGFLCANYAGRAARAASIFTNFSVKKLKFDEGALNAGVRPSRPNVIDFNGAKGTLSERLSKDIIAQYGIPVTQEVLMLLEDVLNLTASPVDFPVAVKIASPDIPHKTEANAVRLNVKSLDELKEAAQAVTSAGLRYMPTARIDGISIQEMTTGVEVILGAINDAQFGPYVMVGLGGVLTEVLHDVTHRFAPISKNMALEMVSELSGSKVLSGYRGSPVSDIDALAQAIVNLSWFITDHETSVAEVDINPVFVRPIGQGIVAADALVVMKG